MMFELKNAALPRSPVAIIAIVAIVAIVAIAACSRSESSKVSATASPPVDHATMTAEQHAAMHGAADSSSKPADTAFAAMQKRGGMAMGVDQYTSTHKFDITPDGGRIELQRNSHDSLGIAQIRAHLKLIRHAFQAGDFSTPAFVHLRDMPGTAVMSRKRGAITYSYADLPLGGEVRVTSSDPEAIAAIHQFMLAQRAEHHAGGSATPNH
jgi:hypothetical protein